MTKGPSHGGKGSKQRPGSNYGNNYSNIDWSKKPNPVKKNMDKLHKPATHTDQTKYDRKVYKDSSIEYD